jgi:two-component system sensor histidine kinase DesK
LVWLAYTAFLFIDPILEPSLLLWLATLVVFVLFLGVFATVLRCSNTSTPVRYWMIAATMLLGLASFPWNSGANTFFVYAAAFLPFTMVSLRRVLAVFLLEALLVAGEGYVFHAHRGVFHIAWQSTAMALFLMVVVGGGNVFYAQQQYAARALREAQEENIALAALAERERIARDLHDVLGHTLSVIVLKAELAGRLMERGEAGGVQRATTEIADVERIARASLAEVREAIGGYRARGLAAEIDAARRTLDAAGVTLRVDSEDASTYAGKLSSAEETALSLALREAVTNIVRHARATTCRLRLFTDAGQRRLVVEDNGEHAVTREGNGLRGMRERIESLGGRLQLEQDKGTRLLIELPLRTQPETT